MVVEITTVGGGGDKYSVAEILSVCLHFQFKVLGSKTLPPQVVNVTGAGPDMGSSSSSRSESI